MIAWITGGGTGIGRAVAERLYREGSRVIITGRRKSVLEEAQREMSSQPASGEIRAIAGDAADPAHARDVVAEAAKRWGAIDLLVNNAGTNPVHKILDTPLEEYRTTFETNCLSAINCTLAVLPEMLNAKRGAIVNIASIYGRWGSATSASYSVSKFAIAGFTESLQQTLNDIPIHVMSVFPGFIRTDMTMPHVVPGSLRSNMGRSPDQMARALLRSLRRKKRDLYYPWYVPWVLRMHRWFPRTADRLAQRVKR